jgi:hypothetical protein
MSRLAAPSRQLAVTFISAWAILLSLPCSYVVAEESVAAKTTAARDPKLDSIFLAIAKNYQKWGRVDDSLRVAPTMCAAPSSQPPSVAEPRFSNADDASTHGNKLYSLFAADRNAYLAAFQANAAKTTAAKVPVEIANLRGPKQVLVKESWTIKEVTNEERAKLEERETKKPAYPGDHFSRFVSKDGKTFHADEKAGLFVMVQFDPDQKGAGQKDTDAGWVYGTVSPDGKHVTSSGLVQSCMNCHQQAPHGRLFGLPPSP